jgi:hypothetical protein
LVRPPDGIVQLCRGRPGYARGGRGGRSNEVAAHFAKLVTRPRTGAKFGGDFEGNYIESGAVEQAPAGSVLLVVDARVSPAGRRNGYVVELYTITEPPEVELEEGCSQEGAERAVEAALKAAVHLELRLPTGYEWGKTVCERVAALLGDNVDELEAGRLQRLYGPCGEAVGALVDSLLELNHAEWQELARLSAESDVEVVSVAADKAFELAGALGREREYGNVGRIWRKVERQAERAVGLDELRGFLSDDAKQGAHERLDPLRLAVENAAVAALLSDELYEDDYAVLTDAFARLDSAGAVA